MKLIFASKNEGKVREVTHILSDLTNEIYSLNDINKNVTLTSDDKRSEKDNIIGKIPNLNIEIKTTKKFN